MEIVEVAEIEVGDEGGLESGRSLGDDRVFGKGVITRRENGGAGELEVHVGHAGRFPTLPAATT